MLSDSDRFYVTADPPLSVLCLPDATANTSIIHLHRPSAFCGAAQQQRHANESRLTKGAIDFSRAMHHTGERWSKRAGNSLTYWDMLNGAVHNGPFRHNRKLSCKNACGKTAPCQMFCCKGWFALSHELSVWNGLKQSKLFLWEEMWEESCR